MRFIFLLAVLVLGGLVLLASFLVDKQTLSASELGHIQQNLSIATRSCSVR